MAAGLGGHRELGPGLQLQAEMHGQDDTLINNPMYSERQVHVPWSSLHSSRVLARIYCDCISKHSVGEPRGYLSTFVGNH